MRSVRISAYGYTQGGLQGLCSGVCIVHSQIKTLAWLAKIEVI